MNQECAGSAGWIQELELFYLCEGFGVGRDTRVVIEEQRRTFARQSAALECRGHCQARQSLDELLRRVEDSAPLAIAGFHQRLEHLAEHFRIDRGLRPCGCVFAGGEAIADEHLTEKGAECVIRESRMPMDALDGRAGEEPAVEEWNAAEGARAWRSLGVVVYAFITAAEPNGAIVNAARAPITSHF